MLPALIATGVRGARQTATPTSLRPTRARKSLYRNIQDLARRRRFWDAHETIARIFVCVRA
jgi:hypothetical protein